MTPQIDGLRKTSPVLRVSTHIYGISKEIDGKTFILRVNLGMWSILKLMWPSQQNEPCSECFNTHLWVSKKIDGKTFIFRVNLGMWSLKLMVSEKWVLFWCVSTHIYGISKEIDWKTFILRVNLGMWPLKSIISKNWALLMWPLKSISLRQLSPVLRVSTHI